MQHVHHGSCGCGDDSRGRLDLYALNETLTSSEVHCLNEKETGSGSSVVCCKWENRLAKASMQSCSSDIDGELIFQINFGELVAVKGIIIRSPFRSRRPTLVKLYADPGVEVDFSNIADIKPAHQGVVDFDPLADKPILFRSVAFKSLANLYVYVGQPPSSGLAALEAEDAKGIDEEDQALLDKTQDQIVVSYLGILGAATKTMRVAPKTAYEVAPQPGDHPVEQFTKSGLGFGL